MRKFTGILLTVTVSFALGSCGEGGSPLTGNGPEVACVSTETVGQLKQMIFDEARKMENGDPLPLNDLQRASVVKVEMPLLKGHEKALDRTTCTGRLRVALPTGSGPAFAGRRELEADVEYTIQPAADKSGMIYQIEGIGPLTMPLASADLSLWTRAVVRPEDPVGVPVEAAVAVEAAPPAEVAAAEAPAAQIIIGNPSFDCRRAGGYAERAICASITLSTKDNRMAALYRQARQKGVDSVRLSEMDAEQRQWLGQRDDCNTPACISEAYDTRIAQLNY